MATSADRAGKTAVKAEPNVIPMIDIMLVLLIIFMIVTPLITNGFQAVMPVGENIDEHPEGEDEHTLGIAENGTYFLDGAMIAAEALPDQLKAMYATREKDKILYFRADRNLKYATIQDAVEIARMAGVRVMAAITELENPGGLFSLKKKKEE